MIFTYKKWKIFCEKLQKAGIQSIPAREVTPNCGKYVVLKHDVETNVSSACRMAQIEHDCGHRSSYYVQAYLLENEANVRLLQKMRDMGHEISYHYDVMDSCKGNLEKAIEEFEANYKRFESNGFPIVTVCQHGNPVVERVGYTSNRDFFRSEKVQALYPNVADIMVNYPEKYQTTYGYYSDAGRIFKKIFDPINNDRIPSEEQNTPYKDLDELFVAINGQERSILSTHPHRWCASAVKYVAKSAIFKTVKFTAKLLLKIPFMKKILGRFYYLAKKF